MQQSATYQAIVQKGRELEARRMLFLLGEKRCGVPDADTRAAIERLGDVAQLEKLAARLLSAESWQELLAAPTRRAPRRKTRS